MGLVFQVKRIDFKQLLIVDGKKANWCRCLSHAPVPQELIFNPLTESAVSNFTFITDRQSGEQGTKKAGGATPASCRI